MIEAVGGRERQLAAHTYFRTARGLCATCLAPCDGKVVFQAGRALLRVTCPAHGPRETLLASSAEWYLAVAGLPVPWSPPARPRTRVSAGCPLDCGPCSSHGAPTVRLEVPGDAGSVEALARRASLEGVPTLRLDARATAAGSLEALLSSVRRLFGGALEVLLPALPARPAEAAALLARAHAVGIRLVAVSSDRPAAELLGLFAELASDGSTSTLELVPERAGPGGTRPTLPELATRVAEGSSGRLDRDAFHPEPGVPPLCVAVASFSTSGGATRRVVLHDLMDVENFDAGRAVVCPFAVPDSEGRRLPPCIAALRLPTGALVAALPQLP